MYARTGDKQQHVGNGRCGGCDIEGATKHFVFHTQNSRKGRAVQVVELLEIPVAISWVMVRRDDVAARLGGEIALEAHAVHACLEHALVFLIPSTATKGAQRHRLEKFNRQKRNTASTTKEKRRW